MKVLLVLITFLLSINIYSLPRKRGVGTIVVLEAPVFSAPSREAKLLQLVRKGQDIYIHPRHFLGGNYERNYLNYDKLPIDNPEVSPEGEEFYETTDKNGNSGYIPKRFVKLVFQDDREFSQNISPFRENDPTDYRLEEPLPDTYPLISRKRRRAFFTVGVGPDLKSSYEYPSFIEKESYSERYALNVAYLFKANWDKFDRFYFGGNFHLWTSQSKFVLSDGIDATELKGQVGLGPMISYDFWRTENWRLSSAFSVSLNFNRIIATQDEFVDTGFEERSFSGFSVSPRITTYFQKRRFIENSDFVFGIDYQAYLPHTLQAGGNPVTDFWTGNTYSVPFSGHWTFNVGIQAYY